MPSGDPDATVLDAAYDYCMMPTPSVELTDFGAALELYGAAAAAIDRLPA